MYALRDSIRQRDFRAKVKPLVDLFAHLSRCEANYTRLEKLLCDGADRLFHSKDINFGSGLVPFIFKFAKLSKYTSQVVIYQEAPDGIPNMHLKLHLYHDTRSAEVVSYQRHHNFHVLETSPKLPRTMRFEKIEMNCFLSELLDHCLEFGLNFRQSVKATHSQGSSI